MKSIISITIIVAALQGQVSLSNGNLPASVPSYRYNDQYNGANGAPNNGRSTFGDSMETAWATDGNVFVTFGDTSGFSVSGVSTCGGKNLIVGKFSGSVPYLNGTNVNCMTAFGGQTQTGFGYCLSTTQKPGGILYINDGSTTTGLYMWVECVQIGPPFQYNNSTLMYSPDEGITWCAPGHTGGSCNTNGDVPSSPQFSGTKEAIIRFVQYERGASGTISFDGNSVYIYAMSFLDSSPFATYLMRATRGSNLQLAASWQFFTGSIGADIGIAGNWSSSDVSATQLITADNDGHIRYIPGYGYLKTDTFSASKDLKFYRASTLTGPWTSVFYEAPINPPLYGFPDMNLSSLTEANGVASAYMLFSGDPSLQSGDPSVNQYSAFWRKLTINYLYLTSSSQGISLAGGALQ